MEKLRALRVYLVAEASMYWQESGVRLAVHTMRWAIIWWYSVSFEPVGSHSCELVACREIWFCWKPRIINYIMGSPELWAGGKPELWTVRRVMNWWGAVIDELVGDFDIWSGKKPWDISWWRAIFRHAIGEIKNDWHSRATWLINRPMRSKKDI